MASFGKKDLAGEKKKLKKNKLKIEINPSAKFGINAEQSRSIKR